MMVLVSHVSSPSVNQPTCCGVRFSMGASRYFVRRYREPTGSCRPPLLVQLAVAVPCVSVAGIKAAGAGDAVQFVVDGFPFGDPEVQVLA
jgi:hypothetical protein